MPIKHCPKCNQEQEMMVIPLETGPHKAQFRCMVCDFFCGFEAKDKNKPKLEKRPNGAATPADLGINYCQVCLKPVDKCHREYLCTHHIDDDPTHNDRLNLLIVCYPCHALIHWTRKYTNND